MSSCTIAETKNNLSSILAALANGVEREHIIKNRNVPVAVITPYAAKAEPARQFGFAKDDGMVVDWDAFDALDDEIADMFGA